MSTQRSYYVEAACVALNGQGPHGKATKLITLPNVKSDEPTLAAVKDACEEHLNMKGWRVLKITVTRHSERY